jgi:alkanesulfonate monooxygenase SsuD/methylene tetrahydromethanopterin reductase-like flavin-dependent oxidoreductase (luciferase family)
VGFYGVDPEAGPRQFPEALRLIKQGLASDELSFSGEFYEFDAVPMVLKPVQTPHPPLWYGVTAPQSAHWAALERANCVTLGPTALVAKIIEAYKAEWAGFGRSEESLPLLGIQRHVVLADSETEALEAAERSYKVWLGHMRWLWDRYGVEFPLPLPDVVGPWLELGGAFAGTADGFREFVAREAETTGATYFVCDVAFGDVTHEEAMRTTALIGREVMPAFGPLAASRLAT